MFLSKSKIGIFTNLVILASIMTGSFATSLHAEEGCGSDFNVGNGNQKSSETNYTIEAELAPSQKVFEHPSFTIKDIVKANVSYYDAANGCAGKIKYENLWYSNGKPLGIEKTCDLKIPVDTKVAIKIKQTESASEEEGKASANLILRVGLDILINRGKVNKVSVPSAALNNIIAQMQKYHAKIVPPDAEPPSDAKVVFPLESDSTGLKQTVYFL